MISSKKGRTTETMFNSVATLLQISLNLVLVLLNFKIIESFSHLSIFYS